MVRPAGFANFHLVIFVFSGMAMTATAIYSAGPWASCPASSAHPSCSPPSSCWRWPAATSCSSSCKNFLSLLGYWNTSFFVILATEHYLYRGGLRRGFRGYDLEGWNDLRGLPFGWAGGLAFAAGVAGAVVGRSETFYVGVLAAKIGESSGDVGNQLSFLFTLAVYVPVRWAERRFTGT